MTTMAPVQTMDTEGHLHHGRQRALGEAVARVKLDAAASHPYRVTRGSHGL